MSLLWIHRGAGLKGLGDAARIDVGTGPDRFDRASSSLARAFDSGAVLAFGSFTFDHESTGSVVVIPERVERFQVSEPTGVVPKIRYAGASASELEWLEAVDAATKRIDADELSKVVLARDVRVWAKTALDPSLLAFRLAVRFPECFTFLVDGLVGATPELLVRRRARWVESLVLAGTVARGASAEADADLGQSLLGSYKEGDEHRFAVESVTDVLHDICDEVSVDPRPTLLKLANVQHLATHVRARLGSDLSALEVAGRLHPTAAVCGTPRAAAMDAIRTLEGMDRGRYAGPVGWVDAAGDGEFGIALRCAEVNGDRARLFAGNGIVAGSLPESELEETRLKLRAMQSALEA
jgi:menaquinone-specific isochorismate synthase